MNQLLSAVPVARRSATLVGLGVASLLSPSAARAAEPTPLDTTSPIAIGASGTTIAWLRPSDEVGDRARLVVRDGAGSTPRVVGRALPLRPVGLTVGTTSSGTPVAVVATAGTVARRARPSSQPVRRGALYVLPLDGSAAPKRLRLSAAGTDLYAPGLLRGRLSFARLQRLHGQQRWTLRTGTLNGRASRVVATPKAGTAIEATTPIRAGGTAFVSATPNRTTKGYGYALRVVRAGGRESVTSRRSIGGAARNETGFGPLTVSTSGDRISAVRGTSGLRTWGASTGRLLSAVPTGTGNGLAVPVGAEGLAAVGDDGTLRLVAARD